MITTERNAYELATLAGTYSPDAPDSPGATFLLAVAAAYAERAADGDWDDDVTEIADAAVPIYTHERWLAFVDLGAYNEDVSELGAESSDMTKCAGVALYMIAERLLCALRDREDES